VRLDEGNNANAKGSSHQLSTVDRFRQQGAFGAGMISLCF
jgi:hypothetical protein